MGKASGVSRRRKTKYNYNRGNKLKRLHKKKLALPSIPSKPVKHAWDSSRSYLKNMAYMGLSDDPNKTIGPKSKENIPKKMEVITELEAKANAPRPKSHRLPPEPVKYCVYMIEKHGEDYYAMSKDSKNYYQETPAAIKKKILKFKSIPHQWNGYLRAKGL